jgi:hypothetical protein
MLLVAVPGHHIFNRLQPLQNPISFRFIPKLWSAGIRLRDELHLWGWCKASPYHSTGEAGIY